MKWSQAGGEGSVEFLKRETVQLSSLNSKLETFQDRIFGLMNGILRRSQSSEYLL
jgi:hypothetical protein